MPTLNNRFKHNYVIPTCSSVIRDTVRKILKTTDDNPIAHMLCEQACTEDNVIIIRTIDELSIWNHAISTYTPENTVEADICHRLQNNGYWDTPDDPPLTGSL